MIVDQKIPNGRFYHCGGSDTIEDCTYVINTADITDKKFHEFAIFLFESGINHCFKAYIENDSAGALIDREELWLTEESAMIVKLKYAI